MKNESGKTLRLNFSSENVLMRSSQTYHRKNAAFDDPARFADVADRRLALMVQIGFRPAEIAWASDLSIDEIEAHLKILSRQLGGRNSATRSGLDESASAPDQTYPVREPLLEQAMSVFGGRIILAGSKIYLDGIPASFRDLAVAAAARGVEIPYPGLQPLPAAFHTGPSESGGRRRKKSASSHLSIHVPY